MLTNLPTRRADTTRAVDVALSFTGGVARRSLFDTHTARGPPTADRT